MTGSCGVRGAEKVADRASRPPRWQGFGVVFEEAETSSAKGFLRRLDPKEIRVLPVPWEILERESGDRGAYLLVLNLSGQCTLEAGGLGKLTLKKGFYVYVGSAQRNLDKRVERHRRLRKRIFWHIDYLRKVSSWHAVFPIRTEDDIECAVAGDLSRLSEWRVKDFGSSDCRCPSHLFGFTGDPLFLPSFHRMVLYHKADRLLHKYRLLTFPHPYE